MLRHRNVPRVGPPSPGIWWRIKRWFSDNQNGLGVSMVAGLFLLLATSPTQLPSKVLEVGLFGLILVAVLLLRLGFADLVSRFETFAVYDLGLTWRDGVYEARRRHFAAEKTELAIAVVEDVLSGVCRDIRTKYPDRSIAIVLDSGSTITPIFEMLINLGLSVPTKDGTSTLHFYTNNLAGIEDVQQAAYFRNRGYGNYQEEDFTILGGVPLRDYKATTGNDTVRAFNDLVRRKAGASEEELAGEPPVIIVSVLTANWLLCGQDRSTLSLCAHGRGHFEFKKAVYEGSDYVVVVAPLGKIVALDNVDRLNEMVMMSDDEATRKKKYSGIELASNRRETQWLVTSQRGKHSDSPLHQHSYQLHSRLPSRRTNFLMHECCPSFEPSGTRVAQRDEELPHSWTRQFTPELYSEID